MVERDDTGVLGHGDRGEELAGRPLLRGKEDAVAVVAGAQVQAQPVVSEGVVHKQAVVPKAVE